MTPATGGRGLLPHISSDAYSPAASDVATEVQSCSLSDAVGGWQFVILVVDLGIVALRLI
jgi:hypothetical protein